MVWRRNLGDHASKALPTARAQSTRHRLADKIVARDLLQAPERVHKKALPELRPTLRGEAFLRRVHVRDLLDRGRASGLTQIPELSVVSQCAPGQPAHR